MTQERYNELNEEYKKLPDTDDAFEKWSNALGKEYNEWNDLDGELENYLEAKLFELQLNHTMAFGSLFGFDTEKIQPLLEDMNFLRFIHSVYRAGRLHINPDEDPRSEKWVNEFFKMKGEKK